MEEKVKYMKSEEIKHGWLRLRTPPIYDDFWCIKTGNFYYDEMRRRMLDTILCMETKFYCPECGKMLKINVEAVEETPEVVLTTVHQSKTSWKEIEEKKGSLKVGDEIECTLKNGKKATFCVAHLNPDGDGRVAFVVKDCIGKHRMNPTSTNEGGWQATEMREYLNNEIWDLLPDDLKAVIKPRLLKTKSTDLDCRDNLWLLSRMEVFGDQGGGELVDVHFPLFATERDRVKNDEDGETCSWWLGSPYTSNSGYFWLVYTNGSGGNGIAYGSIGVAFGFLI